MRGMMLWPKASTETPGINDAPTRAGGPAARVVDIEDVHVARRIIVSIRYHMIRPQCHGFAARVLRRCRYCQPDSTTLPPPRRVFAA